MIITEDVIATIIEGDQVIVDSDSAALVICEPTESGLGSWKLVIQTDCRERFTISQCTAYLNGGRIGQCYLHEACVSETIFRGIARPPTATLGPASIVPAVQRPLIADRVGELD